ncbi:uncharacterized protein DUF4376 [Azospirillum brasilense]|uniref:Uncharacterized protein DUF4376 n=1 Tax=Azospirillum brasilense TaxID=192 RepID=A0A560BW74_AZOBR|nr:DUF4376 domain-containing protein [Azospirillum brasilense]TWA76862.1 uncharacterized protein DUF4376 [Azospirillum brasilense]
MYYFSNGGFYHTEVHGDAIPADVVPVTDDEHAALFVGQSEGKVIVADADGRPALADPPPPPERTLDERRATVAAAVDALRDQHMAEGAEHGGKRFALDGTSRTDLGGMATTGALVLMGALDWPADYATGWIALDNTRLPLPTPQDGIALAAAVAGRYAALVQAARTIKDAVLASDEPEAIDITAGWPE